MVHFCYERLLSSDGGDTNGLKPFSFEVLKLCLEKIAKKYGVLSPLNSI